MEFRITPQTTIANALAQTEMQTTRLGKLQEQATTGKKILVPSDNPVDLGALLAGKAQDDRLEMYLSNIRSSKSSLDVSASALQEAGAILGQVRSVALEAANSTNSPQALEALAQQVDRLLDRLLDVANTQHAGGYVFSGTSSQTPPFTVSATDGQGRPQAVSYQGDDQRNTVPLGPQQTLATLYSGQEIFDRGAPGAANAFEVLIALRDDLRNQGGLSETDQLQALSGHVGELDRARDNVLLTLGEQSAGLQHLESLENHVQDVQLTTRKLISDLEDADLSELVLQLQSNQNLLQMTLATTARLLDQSLLDFLR